ncbi:ABC transporter substrate-binding protein [Negativibacillus massiliensis]|uniref:ABC transporter substrate-binding protein n=1 Tax=Negativibacillus massiliensis TaxID=1871035 RepID=UPI002A7FB41F|nr:ABC transporter substrate-binding protein [Negativibacillus massiliensis]MDY4047097.1 ABC transporter substrate-binding protein [Negativibacillus massiliensis]
MKKTVSKLLALAMAASLVLSGCGGSGNSGNSEETTGASGSEESTSASSENEIKDLVIPRLASRELETFNILYTQRAEDGENLTSLVDGLLESNPKGELVPCIAEEWGTEDGGLTWTFKLREGVKWVDVNGQEKADCVAQDFATGLEWVLNFYKNDSSNTAMPIEMIKGAKEYYEYTKTLSEEEAKALTAGEGSKFREMVGLETPDDYTVIYHCITEKPYFDSLASYVALYPMAQGMVDELGGADAVRSMNNETMWYNGCYTMTSYIQGNEKIFTKNPMYWDTEAKLFDTVTVKMVESNDVAFQLYQTGDVDYVQLGEAQVNTIAKDANNEFHDYLVPDVPSHFSYQVQFNYNKNKEDGTPDTNWNNAIANEAFRLSWYYGIDFTNYWKRVNAINPMSCENNFYTMKGLVYTSDGTDYTDLVRKEMGMTDENGTTPIRLDAEKAEQYKQQAIEELTAQGVTFPVEADFYISASSQTALDSANVLAQVFSDCLGDDYVKLNIKTYIQSSRNEVSVPHLHSFMINGWGADYGDPQNYLGQMTYGEDNAYYSQEYNYINEVEETEATKALIDTYKEFTTLVNEANAITDDLDARYAAYAKAEAYMLQHAIVLPCYYQIGWCLSRVDNDTKMQPMFGSVGDKMKNWGSNADGYTSEEKGVAEQVAAMVQE